MPPDTPDPTNTQSIREQFLRDVRQRFRQLRGRIRDAVGYESDVLHLKQDSRLADLDDVERFPTDSGKVRAFVRWLRDAFNEEVLEPESRGEGHWSATYIRSAYARGWEQALQRLQEAGVGVGEPDRDVFDLGVPKRQAKRLFSRTFENLKSIRGDAIQQARETLTRGLAEGFNPRKMAKELTSEIETIQRTQAEVLARTEIINSYSDATLDRYDRAGQRGVSVSGEFRTADDSRVCPICESIEAKVFETDEMRSETFQYEADDSEPDSLGGEYRIKPPVHCNCRCSILPVIE
jgi:SPP1 gp7 family putative phage head morphogenesis protein